ncbi:MAG: response regulator [Candidatus Anammoxibacter sp.]
MPDKKTNILFVDDDEDIIVTLNYIFTDTYNVFKAFNAKEALDILQKEDIAIIIADHRMPGMTGTELLIESQKIKPKTIRILLTGYMDLDAGIKAEREGVIHKYLEKPWDDEILDVILEGYAKDYEKSMEDN